MARSPEQRGPFGRWLVSERKARGWTADEMRSRVQEARGFAMAHSTYALLESGQRQPTEEQRAHLTAFLGSEPQEPGKERVDDPALAGLLAAMTRQTDVVTDLLEEMRDLRQERANLAGAVELAALTITELRGEVASLRAEVEGLRARSADTTPPAPGVPR